MIIIVAGTNRPLSKTIEVAHFYQNLLQSHQTPSQILDLADLPDDFVFSALYGNTGQNEGFNALHDVLADAEKLVFVVPEYNNSFPGVLKAFIDGMSYPSVLTNKKCALVGISDGVQGNSLGLSHFTDVLNYLGMSVLAQKVRIPFMQKNFVDGEIKDAFVAKLIDDQARLFLKF